MLLREFGKVKSLGLLSVLNVEFLGTVSVSRLIVSQEIMGIATCIWSDSRKKSEVVTSLELVFRRIKHSHLPGAVNLLAMLSDPVSERERIAECCL